MRQSLLLQRLLLALVLLTGAAFQARAQYPVTANPVFFTDQQAVTITYDANLGNGALRNFTGDVYIWTGVVTDSPTGTTWTFVKSPSFNQPDQAAKMTRSATNPNLYTITITPRTYYPAPATTPIYRLGMIFKDAGGTTVGRDANGQDMYINVSQGAALQVQLTSPASNNGNPTVVAAGTSVTVSGTASSAATLTLTLNGVQVGAAQTGTTFSASVPVTQPGLNTFVLTATAGGSTVTATASVVVPPTVTVAPLPAGAKPDGITYLAGGTSAILAFSAPRKSFVYVIGEFNNWQPTAATLMRRTTASSPAGLSDATGSAADATAGRWWVQIDGLTPGQEYAYQFLVDGQLRVGDPYCEKVLDPFNDRFINTDNNNYVVYPNLKPYPAGQTTGLVSVLQTNQPAYVFQNTSFQRPARKDLVVYELHIRDFIARHDYQTLTDTLQYLSRLGVNAIELMPVNEFDGNDSWGYNPCYYFAPDKYYGTKDGLKKFIDECHRRGIAVILDMVLNQSTGQSPMVQLYGNISSGPAADNPWFNTTAPHPYSVFNDLNHESPYTRYFSKKVMQFWLQEYKIDGYRFDLSKGFTQFNSGNDVGLWSAYDQSRVNIWQDYYNTLVATDATMYPILEHLGVNSEEKVLSDIGFMLWGNMSTAYQEASMGYGPGWNLNGGYFADRGWTKPHLMTYRESHDEERTMYKDLRFGNASGPYSTKDPATALQREALTLSAFLTQPGPRMLWEFEEVGYDVSIFADQNGNIPPPPATYGNDQFKVGRKPIRWNYYLDANRRRLYDTYRALIALRLRPDFSAAADNYTYSLSGAVKTSRVVGPDLSVVSVGNFDVTAQTATITFPSIGTWFNYLTGQSLSVTNTSTSFTLQPGQYAVYTSKRVGLPAGSVLSDRPARTTSFQVGLAPNPARGSSTLSYELPTAATASVSVRNVLGQTVRQLAPVRQAAGPQAQTLSTLGLAPGVYLVRLQAGDLTQSTRLVVAE